MADPAEKGIAGGFADLIKEDDAIRNRSFADHARLRLQEASVLYAKGDKTGAEAIITDLGTFLTVASTDKSILDLRGPFIDGLINQAKKENWIPQDLRKVEDLAKQAGNDKGKQEAVFREFVKSAAESGEPSLVEWASKQRSSIAETYGKRSYANGKNNNALTEYIEQKLGEAKKYQSEGRNADASDVLMGLRHLGTGIANGNINSERSYDAKVYDDYAKGAQALFRELNAKGDPARESLRPLDLKRDDFKDATSFLTAIEREKEIRAAPAAPAAKVEPSVETKGDAPAKKAPSPAPGR